jgi:hypothetical protein
LVVGNLGKNRRVTPTSVTVSPPEPAGPAPTTTPAAAKLPATTTAVAPAPAAPALTIASVPEGARISIDGRDTGKVTPASVDVGPPFPRQLRLVLRGYQPLQVRLDRNDLEAGSREFTLVKENPPVKIVLSGAYAFEVLQGSRVLSNAKRTHELTLQPGEEYRLRSREYFLNQSVEIGARQRTVAAPELGTVSMYSTIETCELYIDGQSVGDPPIPRQQVAAGAHAFAARCPDGRSDSQRVVVPAGGRATVNLKPSN